jgi:hypothetical protein
MAYLVENLRGELYELVFTTTMLIKELIGVRSDLFAADFATAGGVQELGR